MSWISDVRLELSKFDDSVRSLRKFGFTVGLVFGLIAALFWYRDVLPAVRTACAGLGLILISGAAFIPGQLRWIYRSWMGLSFALGWIVSRIILSILFVGVMMPIGLLMRLAGKDPLNLAWDRKADSYWIPKDKSKQKDYTKMY